MEGVVMGNEPLIAGVVMVMLLMIYRVMMTLVLYFSHFSNTLPSPS